MHAWLYVLQTCYTVVLAEWESVSGSEGCTDSSPICQAQTQVPTLLFQSSIEPPQSPNQYYILFHWTSLLCSNLRLKGLPKSPTQDSTPLTQCKILGWKGMVWYIFGKFRLWYGLVYFWQVLTLVWFGIVLARYDFGMVWYIFGKFRLWYGLVYFGMGATLRSPPRHSTIPPDQSL